MSTTTETKQVDLEEYDGFDAFDEEIQEDAQELEDQAKSRGHGLKIQTTVQEDKINHQIEKEFVLAFCENLDHFVNLSITKNQLRVMTYILKKMEFGNLISLNQTAIANSLNLNKSNVSKVFKQLKEKQVLIEDEDKNLFVNSNIFAKGLKNGMNQNNRENLRKAQVETDEWERTFKI